MKGYLDRKGFTLIELMIVVAIIGILAAVAIPAYRYYVISSKASETASVLQGIRIAEERYFSEYKRYTDNMANYYPSDCGSRTSTQNWPANDYWTDLGFYPDGPTWYSYRIYSSYTGGTFDTGNSPPAVYTPPLDTSRPWFLAEACGDLDDNGTNARFFVSSQNKTIWRPDDGEY